MLSRKPALLSASMRSVTRGLRAWRRARGPLAPPAASPSLFSARHALTGTEMNAQHAHLEKLRAQGSDSATHLEDLAAGSGDAGQTAAEAVQQWLRENEARYGEGSYSFFRPLYKDLCDEMRREYFTKPPPPPPPPPPSPTPHGRSTSPSAAKETAEASVKPSHTFTAQAQGTEDFSSGFAEGSWMVSYSPANNFVIFRRDSIGSTRQARIVAYSRVDAKDPPRLNAVLTFADWCPIEVMVERRGVIVHFSVACNEGGMHLRNVRAYSSPQPPPPAEEGCTEQTETTSAADRNRSSGEGSDAAETSISTEEHAGSKLHERLPRKVKSLAPASSSFPSPAAAITAKVVSAGASAVVAHGTPAIVLEVTDDAEWCRQNLCYDGPCLWHLELDFLNELYDIMQDHGITLDWMRWAAEWVFYLEHRCYSHWAVGMLEELIPSNRRGPEEDFLLDTERVALDEPAEDWLSARGI